MSGRQKDKLFWLHIKKSAGLSTRTMLQPLYVEVDRVEQPPCFIQSKREQYNDILNNFKVVLGPYQFRRCLFAKEFLYPEDFEQYLRVAFSRNPIDRCVSQFFYLWYKGAMRHRIRRRLLMLSEFNFRSDIGYEFDRFLEAIEECRASTSNFAPYDLHFQTHTAAMWDDVTDNDQTLLLDFVFRLEDLESGINKVRLALDHEPLRKGQKKHINKSSREYFNPSSAQKKKIQTLFGNDFEIYEGMCTQTN